MTIVKYTAFTVKKFTPEVKLNKSNKQMRPSQIGGNVAAQAGNK